MALGGSLSDVFFGDLIQLYCQPRSRARLTARHGKDQVVIYFDDGELVHAESRQAEGGSSRMGIRLVGGCAVA